jgi:hypothetical protein
MTRSVMARAGAVERTARLKIQGPSGKGWIASISPTSTAARFDSVVSRLVDGDALLGAQRGGTLTRPAIAIAGHQPVSVQDPGDEIVVGQQLGLQRNTP